jgi:hypothetical protein
MNVEIGTEALIFLFWEYLFQIFGIFSLQCEPLIKVYVYKNATESEVFIKIKSMKYIAFLDAFQNGER